MENNIYYTQPNIYGVKLYNNNQILFELKYNSIMCDEMKKESYIFYEKLNENLKNDIKFKIYKKCKAIDNDDNFMVWLNISLNYFIKDFCG